MKILIFVIALSVSGCGTRGFKKDGVSYDEFLSDAQYCKEESAKYTTAQWSREGRNDCMGKH